ncbi:MAG: PEP/pyruvate-binding domain-containing protein [Actinomycetota bacterium]
MTAWPLTTIGDHHDAGVDRIGVKGASLARLEEGGFHTAAAFVVEAATYRRAIATSRIDHRLAQIWEVAADASPEEIPMLSRKARHLISEIEFSSGLVAEIRRHLGLLAVARSGTAASRADAPGVDEQLGETLRVAVRSSATPGAVSGPECAGVHATYLSVAGVDQVVARVHSCWASMFGERALSMRAHGLGADDPAMAVVVQVMVDADASGLITPTGSPSEVLVEATFGLGEPIISGAVEPDRYVVDRLGHETRSVTIGRKQILLPGDASGHRFADPDRINDRVLNDAQLGELGVLSAAIDHHFDSPQEVEWSIDASGIVVLQVRPITPGHHVDVPIAHRCVSGIGVGFGWATGRVRVVDRADDLGELRDGEILVVPATTPEWIPHIERASALVTDDGDATSHAARVAAELGLPCIVGTEDATTVLETGQYVTVDCGRGWVVPSVTFADAV